MERVEEILKQHEEQLDRHQNAIETLKQSQSDTVRLFEKFQLKSDLLQQRSNEMFLEIKAGQQDLRGIIETIRKEQDEEHFRKPKRRADDMKMSAIMSVISTVIGILVGLLFSNLL